MWIKGGKCCLVNTDNVRLILNTGDSIEFKFCDGEGCFTEMDSAEMAEYVFERICFYLSVGDKFLDILAAKDEYKKLAARERAKGDEDN